MGTKIFVTGATGYLGRRCALALGNSGYTVLCGTRSPQHEVLNKGCEWVVYGDLTDSALLDQAVVGCDVVIHFAGHAHVPETPEGIAQAQRTNVGGTAKMVTASARAGVKRFIFISSALVLAGSRDRDGRIHDGSSPQPLTAYAQSKLDAEQQLQEIAEQTGMQWLVLRPPMVYGPGSPGNFNRLLRLVDLALPLPLGCATGRKNMIFVENLLSLIHVAVEHPKACCAAFLVGDADVTSTADLIRLISEGLSRPVRLLPLPQAVCRSLGKALGREQDVNRLFDPLYFGLDGVSSSLGWHPPVRLTDGVAATVGAWRERK
jgi:nucleoside-diphosphate-sugar epimerase